MDQITSSEKTRLNFASPANLMTKLGDLIYNIIAAINAHTGMGGVTHPDATITVSGFMSAADKVRLGGIADGANAYVHPDHTGDVTSVADGAQTIAANAVTNAKLAQVAANVIKGRVAAGTGDVEDLTAVNVRTIINVEDGANAYVHPSSHQAAIIDVTDAGGYFAGENAETVLAEIGKIIQGRFTVSALTAVAGVLTMDMDSNLYKSWSVEMDNDRLQVETATIVGTITTSGNATVTVTADTMNNSSKAVSVAVSQGVLQQETAVAAGEISTSGDAKVTVTANGMGGTPKAVAVAVDQGTKQVETATVVGTITGDGNAAVVVTAAGMNDSPKTIGVQVSQGVLQAIEISVAANVTTAGDCTVILTADGMTGSSISKSVTVAKYDLGDDVAGKIRTALEADANITAWFTIARDEEVITLTAKAEAANDPTMALTVEDDTSVGVTTGSSSIITAGVAPDDASAVADTIRICLALYTDITDFFTISGAGAEVILTAKSEAADDTTMNIAIDNGTCAGLTPAPLSADTTPGVAPDDAAAIAGKIRTALGLDVDVSAFFTISGADANIILTAKAEAADDVTMNIAIENDTCAGITEDLVSDDTTAGVAPDDASAVAEKVRVALAADADVGAFFDVSGAGADVVLTVKAAAADDATMNIAYDNDTCAGLTPDATSDDTTAGGTVDKEFVFDNVVATAGKVSRVEILIDYKAATVVTWPATVIWAGGAAPNPSASDIYKVTLSTYDNGVTWLGEFTAAFA